MTTRAVFAYQNLDDTADLNAHFKALVNKGVISGGKILPVAGTSNVSITSFYASSNDGMILWSDSATTVACSPGQVNYIVLRAVYNAPSDPTLSYECMNASAYASDPQAAYLILFGTVDLTTVATVSAASISYAKRDSVDRVKHIQFLGTFGSTSDRDAAYPSVQPVTQRPNDFVLVTSAINSLPSFYYWNGTQWKDFGNYEQLKSDFNSHTAGVVGNGDVVHVTADQKAALSGSNGTPSASNRFVTENDPNLILSSDQKAALANAVGGPIKNVNPVVANNVAVAIPVIVSFTPATAQDFVNITYANNGSGPFFGAPVLVGRLGIDTAQNKSSAAGWFVVQDSMFNGYVDEDGPLFIEDIQDYTGSGSYNPASDIQNVTSIGYWAPSAGSSALRIKFNRILAAQKTVYIRCYVKGTIGELAPGGAYYPASTASFSGQIAHQSVHTQVVTYQQATTAEVQFLRAYAGSSASPSISFKDNPTSGIYYVGNVETANTTYSSVGVSVDQDTVLVVAKHKAGDVSGLDDNEMPFVIEQVVSDSDIGSIRLYGYKGVDLTPSLRYITMGLSSYNAGFTPTITIGRADGSNVYGLTVHQKLLMLSGQQILADAGTESAPGICFSNAIHTGFSYLGTVAAGSDPSAGKTYNAIGVSLNGNTTFIFSSNAVNSATSSSSPMLFEQYMDDDSSLASSYRIGAISDGGSTGGTKLSFGISTYNSDWSEYASISAAGLEVKGTVVNAIKIQFNSGSYVSASGSTLNLGTSAGVFLTYAGSTSTATHSISLSKFNGTIQLSKTDMAAGYSSIGNEANPAIQFGSVKDGIYWTSLITGSDNTESDPDSNRSTLCFVSGTKTVLAVGRNATSTTSGLGEIDMPLVIEQVILPDVVPATQINLMHRIDDGDHNARKLQIGFGDYHTSFTSWVDFNSNGLAGSQPIVFFKKAQFSDITYFDKSINVTTSVSAASLSVSGVATLGSISTGSSGTDLEIGWSSGTSFTPTAKISSNGRFFGYTSSLNTVTYSFMNHESSGLGRNGSGQVFLRDDTSALLFGNNVLNADSAQLIVGSAANPVKVYGNISEVSSQPDTFADITLAIGPGIPNLYFGDDTLHHMTFDWGSVAPSNNNIIIKGTLPITYTSGSAYGISITPDTALKDSQFFANMQTNERIYIDISMNVVIDHDLDYVFIGTDHFTADGTTNMKFNAVKWYSMYNHISMRYVVLKNSSNSPVVDLISCSAYRMLGALTNW